METPVGQKLIAYSIRKDKTGEAVWIRAGCAFVNMDGSINVYLDVLPLDGTLHIRSVATNKPDPK